MAIREFAPAKINLCLHVTGQRADGFHLLDSLVCFADVGDRLTVEPADDISLNITGPMAAGLTTAGDNLVLRAARLMSNGQGARITLEKNLPLAAGLGGGSADAAACLRALATLWQCPLPDAPDVTALGADVPVCLRSQSAQMSGIGDIIQKVPDMPDYDALLVNPGVTAATADVFTALNGNFGQKMTATPDTSDRVAWAAFLGDQRNDLQNATIALAPVTAKVLNELQATEGALIVRMSGSGATCFALYADQSSARVAGDAIQAKNPAWWVKPTRLGHSGTNI